MMTEEERIEAGKTIRREVLGAAHVEGSGTEPTAFARAFTEFANEHCWGNVWVRPGLDKKTRSMLNLAMLSSMARWHEFEVHVRGALNNGVTEDEIIEICLQAGVYAGIPIAAEAFRVADRAVAAYRSSAGAIKPVPG